MKLAFGQTWSLRSEGRYDRASRVTASKTAVRYDPTGSDFVGSFYGVLRKWQRETAFLSDPSEIVRNPSYQALVTNGKQVTPLIINELKRTPSLLVWVLEDTYGIQPYSQDDAGNIPAMTDAWLSWAERSG